MSDARFVEGSASISSPVFVLTGKHARSIEHIPWGGRSFWHPDVQKKFASIQPAPFVIAPDSLFPGTGATADQFVPAQDINHIGVPGAEIHLIAADIPGTSKEMSVYAQKGVWERVFAELHAIDPTFQHPGALGAFVRTQMDIAYKGEAVAAGLTTLTGYGLARLLQKAHVSRQTPIPEPGSLQKRNRGINRRQFIQGAAAAAGGGLLAWARSPIFWNASIISEKTGTSESLLQIVARVTKPIFYDTDYLNMRNERVTMALLDDLYQVQKRDKPATGVSVWGSMHRVGTYPGLKVGESIEAARARISLSYTRKVSHVVQNIKKDRSIPTDVANPLLKALFSEYEIYLMPQYKAGEQKLSNIYQDSNSWKSLWEVDMLIDRLMPIHT